MISHIITLSKNMCSFLLMTSDWKQAICLGSTIHFWSEWGIINMAIIVFMLWQVESLYLVPRLLDCPMSSTSCFTQAHEDEGWCCWSFPVSPFIYPVLFCYAPPKRFLLKNYGEDASYLTGEPRHSFCPAWNSPHCRLEEPCGLRCALTNLCAVLPSRLASAPGACRWRQDSVSRLSFQSYQQ